MDTLALRYKLKLLIQMDRSDLKTIAVPKLTSLLSQRNIFESHLMDEHMVKFLDKFKYIFKRKSTLLSFKLPLVVYFYRRKRFKTEVFILGPTLSHIFGKFLEIYAQPKIKRKNRKKMRLQKYIESTQTNKKRVQYVGEHVFKSFLLKNFFFTHLLSLYTFKLNLMGMPGLVVSLRHRLELKKRKINFRRKLRYDSEGRVVNL